MSVKPRQFLDPDAFACRCIRAPWLLYVHAGYRSLSINAQLVRIRRELGNPAEPTTHHPPNAMIAMVSAMPSATIAHPVFHPP
jgi:hypothetical protein